VLLVFPQFDRCVPATRPGKEVTVAQQRARIPARRRGIMIPRDLRRNKNKMLDSLPQSQRVGVQAELVNGWSGVRNRLAVRVIGPDDKRKVDFPFLRGMNAA
jgi:hypothetical protein